MNIDWGNVLYHVIENLITIGLVFFTLYLADKLGVLDVLP